METKTRKINNGPVRFQTVTPGKSAKRRPTYADAQAVIEASAHSEAIRSMKMAQALEGIPEECYDDVVIATHRGDLSKPTVIRKKLCVLTPSGSFVEIANFGEVYSRDLACAISNHIRQWIDDNPDDL